MSTVPASARSARRLLDPSPDAVGVRRGRSQAQEATEDGPPPKASPLTVLPRGYRVPRSPRARRRRRRIVVGASMVASLAGVFGLVLVHVQLTTNQLRLVHLQQGADNQEERYLKLRLQVAQLESPERVVATAQQLGMVTPTTITYLTAPAGTPATAEAPIETAGLPRHGWASTKLNDSRQ